MRSAIRFLLASLLAVCGSVAFSQAQNPHNPTWWAKYNYLVTHGVRQSSMVTTASFTVGANVDVSNECGPQSETYITLNPASPNTLAMAPTRSFASRCADIFPPMAGLIGVVLTCHFRGRLARMG